MTEPALPQAVPQPPRKTLVFHIGDHKTGSTAIQYALVQNRIQVAGSNVAYSADLNHNPQAAFFKSLARDTGPDDLRRAQKKITALARSVAESTAAYHVISAEEFEGMPAAAFRQIVDRHFADCADEIRIIAYVRPHAQRILSSFAERIKIGVFDGDLEHFFGLCKRKGKFVYQPRFQAWREAFGDRFILRPFVRDQLAGQSVLTDFCDQVFRGQPYQVLADGKDNSALGLEDLMRLKLLQDQIQGRDRAHRLALGWEVSRLLASLPRPASTTPLQMHRGLARKIRKHYAEDAAAMDQAFFGGAPVMQAQLDQAVEDALPRKQSHQPADHLPEAEQHSLRLAGALINSMMDHESGSWPTYFRALRQAELQQGKIAPPTPGDVT